MASIQTQIQLYDQVSQPLNRILGGIASVTAAFENIEGAMSSGMNASVVNNTRQALENTVEAQNELNAALERMDVQDASSAYTQLEQNAQDTAQNIRRNASEQENFNRSIQGGIDQSTKLMDSIKGIVATYLSIQTVKKALDMSDELTMTTARLNMMNEAFNEINGTVMQTDDLVNLVYQAAQNARGSFGDMAAVVAKFGNNARDAFSSQEEVVAFANLIQKQMTIAGASTAEASNAMLQLSQALGSGVLRGDELNSIFEQAPNLIQSIADYMDVPIGQIRAMAQEGQLSADIVKAAIFASADDINAKFNQMPMTWNQVWTSMTNTALMQFQPVLDKINELANNAQFQETLVGIMDGLAMVAVWLLNIMELAGSVASFFQENWSIIAPIIFGIVGALTLYNAVLLIGKGIMLLSAAATAIHTAFTSGWTIATFAQTAAQSGLNAALAACPITWIIALIIALIAVIYAVCQAIAKMTGAANTGFGIIAGGVNVVIQFFKNLGLTVANIALGIGNAIAALAGNMMTAFNNAILSIQSWFYGLLSTALTVVAGICEALNKLPFVEFDFSGITSAADEYAAKSAEAAGNKQEYQSISDAFSEGFNTFDTFQDGWVQDAFASGAAWGDGVMDGLSGFLDGFGDLMNPSIDTSNMFSGSAYDMAGYDGSQIPSNIADTAGNTARTADSLEITDENLKYLRDIAERDVINRFTTAEVHVEFGGVTNNVNSEMDLDGVVDYFANSLQEALEATAEGIHF